MYTRCTAYHSELFNGHSCTQNSTAPVLPTYTQISGSVPMQTPGDLLYHTKPPQVTPTVTSSFTGVHTPVTSNLSDGQNTNLSNVNQSTFSGSDVSVLTAAAQSRCTNISITKNECALVQSNAVAIATPAQPGIVHPSAPNDNTCITSNVVAPALVVPQLVIRQTTPAKMYNGSTNYKHYKEYFEILSQVNGWTTEVERAQNLSLALEGPARDVLKDVSPTSLTVVGKWGFKPVAHELLPLINSIA